MQVMAILRSARGAQRADFAPLMRAEEEQVWRLYAADTIRSMHWSGDPNQPETIAIVFTLEVGRLEEAQAAMTGLPMVKAGLLTMELFALAPWRPLEILFSGPSPKIPDAPEDIVRGFYAAVEKGDASALKSILSDEWEELPAAYSGQPKGAEGYLPVVSAFNAAFPDGRFDIQDLFRAGDRVVVRTIFRGTHRAPFLGREATNKAITFATIDIHEVREGRVSRSWHIEDFMGALAQIDGSH